MSDPTLPIVITQKRLSDRGKHLGFSETVDTDERPPRLPGVNSNKSKKSLVTLLDKSGSDFDIFRQKSINEPTVILRDAYKNYGLANRHVQVLSGCNLHANNAEIYALLGPRSSGKTTVIKTLLGYTKLSQGDVQVFRQHPNLVPRSHIGYAPQSNWVALSLTIPEHFYFYSKIFNVEPEFVKQRLEFLSELLYLPKDRKTLRYYPSYMRRRLLLALAVMHEPKLILLDEPSDGVNPFVRHSWWKYLITLAQDQKRTIIVSTPSTIDVHIAHRIGILYQGKIVLEGTPESIRFRTLELSLDSIFCSVYNPLRHHSITKAMAESLTLTPNLPETEITQRNLLPPFEEKPNKSKTTNAIYLLICIHYLVCSRNFFSIIVWICAPLPLLVIGYYASGAISPATIGRGLDVGVFNQEIVNFTQDCPIIWYSCAFIHYFRQLGTILYQFDSCNELEVGASTGNLDGTIVFPKNITAEMKLFFRDYSTAGKLEFSYIEVKSLAVNKIVLSAFAQLVRRVHRHFFDSVRHHGDIFNASYPLHIQRKGAFGYPNVAYVAPALLLESVTFTATVMGMVSYLINQGNNRRIVKYAIGINVNDRIIVGFMIMSLINIIQIVVLVYAMIAITGMEVKGSTVELILILCVHMIKALVFGRIIGMIFPSWFTATCATIYFELIKISFSAALYPWSGLPVMVQTVSFLIPQTAGNVALRKIAAKGFSISHKMVRPGLYLPFIYFCIYCTIVVTVEHFRKFE